MATEQGIREDVTKIKKSNMLVYIVEYVHSMHCSPALVRKHFEMQFFKIVTMQYTLCIVFSFT